MTTTHLTLDEICEFLGETEAEPRRLIQQIARRLGPVARLAYPARVFTPIEINAADPYSYMAALTAPKIRVIPSLAARKPDEQYQLLVLSMSPDHGLVAGSLAPAPHTPPVRCTQAEQEPSHV